MADTDKKNNVRLDGGSQTSEGGSSTAATAKPAEELEEGTGDSHESGDGADAGAAGDDEHGNDGADDGDDDINPETKKPYTAAEWRDKFRASSKGANELLETKKTLESDIAKVKADGELTIKEKDEEIAKLRAIADGKNPDGLKLEDLAKENKENKDRLVLIEENRLLDDFLSDTKVADAKSFKEALRALSRANPTETLAKLWDKNLKAGAEASAAAKGQRVTTRRAGASDTGRGASSREPAKDQVGNTGLSLEEFNALPVAKRKVLLQKMGA